MKVSPTAQLFRFLSLILYLWVSPFSNHGSSSWIVLYSLLNSSSACLSLQTDKLPKFLFLQMFLKQRFPPLPLQGSFFKRVKQEDTVPTYSAVRIRGEKRGMLPGNDNWKNLQKKNWMATWHDKDDYS